MATMSGATPLRNQPLDWSSQQLFARVPKHALGLLVDEGDAPLAIYGKQRIRRKLDDLAEWVRACGWRADLFISSFA
jgi:hypothetical protein